MKDALHIHCRNLEMSLKLTMMCIHLSSWFISSKYDFRVPFRHTNVDRHINYVFTFPKSSWHKRCYLVKEAKLNSKHQNTPKRYSVTTSNGSFKRLKYFKCFPYVTCIMGRVYLWYNISLVFDNVFNVNMYCIGLHRFGLCKRNFIMLTFLTNLCQCT